MQTSEPPKYGTTATGSNVIATWGNALPKTGELEGRETAGLLFVSSHSLPNANFWENRSRKMRAKSLKTLVTPGRVELPTISLEGCDGRE
jgi:hypothetical protein